MKFVFDEEYAKKLRDEERHDELFRYASRGAEHDDAAAQFWLAKCYEGGIGIEKNEKEAIRLFKLSAEHGSEIAQIIVGLYYSCGLCGLTRDEEKTYEWYRYFAEQGFAKAQYQLGTCYYQGSGVPKDEKEALKWWTRSAEQGEAAGQYELGSRHFFGDGVAKNQKEAVKWLELSAEQGYEDAQYFLAALECGIDEDETRDIFRLKQRAMHGDADAQHNLGDEYFCGKGVAENKKEAVKWYRLSAEQDDECAQYMLGYCYYEGKGVDKDKAEAIGWWEKSAKQGFDLAQYELGCCYFVGDGVIKNQREAVKWVKLSAEQGNEDAQCFLKHCFDSGCDVSRSESKDTFCQKIQAMHAGSDAQCDLGDAYYFGWKWKGVAENKEEAVKWYRLSAEQGNAKAQTRLGNCYFYGDGVSKNEEEAVKWWRKSAKQGDSSALSILSCTEGVALLVQSLLEEIEEKRITDAFNETTEKLNKSASRDENLAEAEKEYLQSLFGKNWDKLQEYTKASLVSASVFLKQVQGNDLDFSGVVIAATSALENEMKHYFFDRYQAYLASTYGEPKGEDSKKWPKSMLYTKRTNFSTKIYERNKVFTFGSLPHIFIKQNFEDKKVLDEYLCTVLKPEFVNQGEKTFDSVEDIVQRCEQVRADYRNPAAHTEKVDRKLAEECYDKIVGPMDRISSSREVGRIVGILYDLMQIVR